MVVKIQGLQGLMVSQPVRPWLE